MGRMIDADALEKKLSKLWNCHDDHEFADKDIWRELENAPTIEERKKGKWIRIPMACYGGGTITEYKCSECSEHQIIESKWCPNCGCKMEGEQP